MVLLVIEFSIDNTSSATPAFFIDYSQTANVTIFCIKIIEILVAVTP